MATGFPLQVTNTGYGGIPNRNGTTVANFLGVTNPTRQAQVAPNRPPLYTAEDAARVAAQAPQPAPTTAPASGGTTTSSTGTGGSTYVDPYTKQLTTARNTWNTSLPGAINNINQNSTDAFTSGGREMMARAESLYNTTNAGQRDINTARENVELTRMNGIQDILDFVRQGMVNTSRAMSARGASSSSAGEQFARGFSAKAEGMSRNVNNDAFMDDKTLNTEQENLNVATTQGKKDLERSRDSIVDKIGSELRRDLYALDMEGQKLGITGKVQIEQLKREAIERGMGKLQEADTWLSSQMGGIKANDTATIKRNAAESRFAGLNSGRVLDYNTFAGMAQPPQAGPSVSPLPLFTRNKRV